MALHLPGVGGDGKGGVDPGEGEDVVGGGDPEEGSEGGGDPEEGRMEEGSEGGGDPEEGGEEGSEGGSEDSFDFEVDDFFVTHASDSAARADARAEVERAQRLRGDGYSSPEPTISALSVCRRWRGLLRGSPPHLAALMAEADAGPLLAATRGGHEAVVRHLLCLPAGGPAAHADDRSLALLSTAANGHGLIVRLLLEHPVLWVPADVMDSQALWTVAAVHGDVGIARLLMEQPRCGARADYGALIDAVGRGDVPMARLLLGAAVHLARADWANGTLLLSAIYSSNEDMVQLLLSQPVNSPRASCQDNKGLYDSVKSARAGMVRLLLSAPQHAARADSIPDDLMIEMLWRPDIVRLLVSQPHTAWTDAYGGCVLVAAAGFAGLEDVAPEAVRALLEAQTALADCWGGCALLAAATRGNEGVVRLLMSQTQHPARGDCSRGDALVLAATHGRLGIVQLLLAAPEHAPAAPTVSRALAAAAAAGQAECATWLLGRVADAYAAVVACADADAAPCACASACVCRCETLVDERADRLVDAQTGFVATVRRALVAVAERGHRKVEIIWEQYPGYKYVPGFDAVGQALVSAARFGHTEVLWALLRCKKPPTCIFDEQVCAALGVADEASAPLLGRWLDQVREREQLCVREHELKRELRKVQQAQRELDDRIRPQVDRDERERVYVLA
ncbi:hypothetical protein FOA52_012220 [Chlamydomonas sp. UWO 241]|nr:hypothetical protein FOA52_012220 [Chlamydomonas sp. UWO 241]